MERDHLVVPEVNKTQAIDGLLDIWVLLVGSALLGEILCKFHGTVTCTIICRFSPKHECSLGIRDSNSRVRR